MASWGYIPIDLIPLGLLITCTFGRISGARCKILENSNTIATIISASLESRNCVRVRPFLRSRLLPPRLSLIEARSYFLHTDPHHGWHSHVATHVPFSGSGRSAPSRHYPNSCPWAHAAADAVLIEQTLVLQACILAASIGMQRQSRCRLALPDCPAQCRGHQLGRHARGNCQ